MGAFVTQEDTPTLFEAGAKQAAPNGRLPDGWTNRNVAQAGDLNALHDALMDARAAIRGREFNVKHYGAVGDGATDDYQAFADAVAALPDTGGQLFIPAGDYRLSQRLVITKPVVLSGAGSTFPGSGFVGATRLLFDEDVAGLYLASSARVSRIANLNLVGSSSVLNTAHGVHIRTQNCVLEGVVVSAFGGHGVCIEADGTLDPETGAATLGHFNTLINVKSRSNLGDGFRVEGAGTYVQTFLSCDASANGGWGFRIESHHNTLINTHTSGNISGAYYDNGSSNLYLRPYIEAGTGSNVTFDTADASLYGTWLQGQYASASSITFTGASRGNWEIRTVGGVWERLTLHDANGPSGGKTYALDSGIYNAGALRLRNVTDSKSIWDVNSSATRFNTLIPLSINSGAIIQKHLSSTTTWNPASVADGAVASTTVTVTGAALGDTVAVGFAVAVPAGALLVGSVTAANTVTVTLFNKTGSALDLGSGTLRADVWQH